MCPHTNIYTVCKRFCIPYIDIYYINIHPDDRYMYTMDTRVLIQTHHIATHCNTLQHTYTYFQDVICLCKGIQQYTGWRRLIGSPKLQIIFHKRATKYRSLLRKTTYKDKGSYEFSPPCTLRRHISLWKYKYCRHAFIKTNVCIFYIFMNFYIPHIDKLVGSMKWQVSFSKEPYKRDIILQKRPIISYVGMYFYIPHIGIQRGFPWGARAGTYTYIYRIHISIYLTQT